MHAYDTVSAAHHSLECYLMFYNQTRPHQALDGQTPDGMYFDNLTTRRTAASSAIRQAPLKEGPTLSNQPEPPLTNGRQINDVLPTDQTAITSGYGTPRPQQLPAYPR